MSIDREIAMPFSHRHFLAWLLLACFAQAAHAEYVPVGSMLPRFNLLKEGSHRYLRYIKTGDSEIPINISRRELRFDGQRMRLTQRWDGAGKAPFTMRTDSTFEIGTFRPLTHTRITDRDGSNTVEGFAFSPERITGLPGLEGNTQTSLSVDSPEQTFNFETDIELLQTLPLAPGYVADINFYHPGGKAAPARYTYKVVGEETIAGPLGPVDCWVVTSDYNQKDHVSKFWFAKQGQLLVRESRPLADGKTLIQTLIG